MLAATVQSYLRQHRLGILYGVFIAMMALMCLSRYRWPHPLSGSNMPLQPRTEQRPVASNYAYATFLRDTVMADAIKMLIYSIKKTANYLFPLLVLPGVTHRQELVQLGAELYELSMLGYPFRTTTEKAAINKMCRYSKLHIWRFTQYQKILCSITPCPLADSTRFLSRSAQ